MAGPNGARRVVITGQGVVSAIGIGVDTFWANMRRGVCGIGPITNIPLQDLYITIAGEVKDFDPRERCPSKPFMLADRYSQFAGSAAIEAMKQAGYDGPVSDGHRAASIIGSGIGGLGTIENGYVDLFIHKKKATHPLTLLRSIGSSAAAHVSIEYGMKGPCFGTVSACSTAAHAIGLTFQMIRAGMVDIGIAGASEACVTFGSMRSWQAMRVLSPEGCWPFSKHRNGTVLAEGAGILVLEELEHALARGATPLAELVGFGMTSDAADMVNPSIEGPSVAMQIALDDARLAPGDIDYINAHGTATTVNDINETRAIRRVFGKDADKVSVSSTKSMHGHCLGAGGGVEAVACIKAISENFVPATIGFDEPGEECDLDYTPNEGRSREITYAMSNSFAFGGLNAALVFGPPPA
ncbi:MULTISPECIES: beta-ketoacyl-[acyl-carrier-protein] synthase family protein [Rhodomicrobium]|uniref:beta-ketoacyl-[acyl-carrier-protein] synthase family protein n=1 Tax=Rhodomicrobium TaxID=1068 RepID=UPI000B4BB165|nr:MULTISPECIES: beta-ketoacyl-[acyl-carrier-protein] synthase family protein [Rhodomicrobium]